MSVETFRLFLFFGMLLGMGSLETFRAVRSSEDSKKKRWLFHGFVTVFNTIFTRFLFVPFVFMWLFWVEEQGWGVARWLGIQGIWEIILTLVLFDFFDYWWHRWNHYVPFLWRFHRAHHADTQVDVTTSLRFHPGELFLSCLAKSIWIVVWGPSLLAFLIFETGITTYSQFHHSNIDFSDRWERVIRWFHMTPRLHAGHHTVTTRTRDANFSTIFLIWDRLFDTLREVDPVELRHLGLDEGRETHLSFGALLKAPLRPLK